jgi:dolichol-phosphate mannosyltransferase
MPKTYHRLTPRLAPALLSIVIPVYNEEAMIPILRNALDHFMSDFPIPLEVVLVNDGSSDESINLLMRWSETDRRIKVISLARNFGHQIAATAGFDFACGDAVVIMDADLQDPLETLHPMVSKYMEGYDVVYGRRVERQGESPFKRLSAFLFYRLMSFLIHPDLPRDVGDFRLVSRKCVNALNSMRETHRFLRGMITWVGFPQTEVAYVRKARAAGVTKYPLSKMLRLAWTAAISFSPLPLRVSFYMGLLLFLLAATQACNALIQMALGYPLVRGWTSIIFVNCLVGGGVLVGIGVLGEYVGQILEEVKRRPLYVVATEANTAAIPEQPDSIHRVELERLREAVAINETSRVNR